MAKNRKNNKEPTEIKSMSFDELLSEARELPGVSLEEAQQMISDIERETKGKVRLSTYFVGK